MNGPQVDYALTIRGAYKRYKNANAILRGLNMTIPQGHIYGLLGPSGCGKTTLLNCIVGRIDLDAGEIQMKGKYRADIGYMPQDLALYSVLSIIETFLYYGRLFGMTITQVERRTEQLVKFLQLPKSSTLVEKLSGGQQRRVSFAVALIHDPQLLILDEPTVGLDPLLSQSIWEHLLKLASNGKKTIIITTHYIEEARQAHIVGLMREGVLLCEDSPNQLMSSHNCDNLEQAFLQLSHKQASACSTEDDQVTKNYDQLTSVRSKPHLKGEVWFLWSRFMAQLIKNWYFMWRNKAMMIFLLGLPLVQCTFYNLAIGHDPIGLNVAVVNEELMSGLSECSSYPSTGCNLDIPLTCRYIDKLKGKTLKIVRNIYGEVLLMGLHPSDISRYDETVDFTCRDGGLTIPFKQVNDDYCDCSDGSDEPATSACENGRFYCINLDHIGRYVHSSRVNDGLCDCCDGSDEYVNKSCTNICKEERLRLEKEAEELAAAKKIHMKFIDTDRRQQLEFAERRQLQIEIDELDEETSNSRTVESNDKGKQHKEDNETGRLHKSYEEDYIHEAFSQLDTNQNGVLELLEIKSEKTFDLNKNAAVEDVEIKWYYDVMPSVIDESVFKLKIWKRIGRLYVLEKELDKSLSFQLEFNTLRAGKAAVDRHDAWGLLHFSQNYSLALVERINVTTDTPHDESQIAIEFSTLNVWMDMSNVYIGNMIREDLIESYVRFLEDLFQDCGWPRQAANIPVKFENPIYGTRNPSFIHAASPAVIVVFMFYLPLMFTVGVLLYEKMAGILERCMVAGVTSLEVVTAHSVIQFVVLCIQGLLMMLIMYIVFDSPFLGNFFWTSNLLIMQGLSGMCFGFLISVISDTMNAASFMGLGSFFPLCSMSGMLWPQEGMHTLLKTISWTLPTSLPTEAMRALTARGWGIEHPAVYRGFLSSAFWIFFFCLMTRLVIKTRKGLRAR